MGKFRFYSGTFSVKSLLICLCVLFTLGLLISFEVHGSNYYVNELTIILTAISSIVLVYIIKDGYKNDNPLLIVLSVWSLMYIYVRVLTLHYTEYSLVFQGYGLNVTDVNKTLTIITLGVLGLWIGLHFKKIRSISSLQLDFSKKEAKLMLCFYWISMGAYLFSAMNIPVISGISSIVSPMILNIHIVSNCFLVYFMLFKDNMDKRDSYIFIASIVFFLLVRLLEGSRAALLEIVKSLCYISLVLKYDSIKSRYIVLSIIMIPVALFFFAATTYMRQLNATNLSVREKVEIFSEVYHRDVSLFEKETLAPVFDRLGFLDYCAMPCSRRDVFKEFVNIRTEFESIVDNALTPGFDVFDAPKISNIQEYYLDNGKVIKKSEQAKYDYSSSEFTIFGEYYVLGGPFFYFPIIILIGYFFKRLWLKFDRQITIKSLYNKVILLYIFEALLTSFGTDWICYRVVCAIITLYIYNKYFSEKIYVTQ